MKGSVGGERLKYPISLQNLLLVIEIRPLRLVRRTKTPVKNDSLQLEPGRKIGLAGGAGSGKASRFALRWVSRTRAAAISRRAMHLCWRDLNARSAWSSFPTTATV